MVLFPYSSGPQLHTRGPHLVGQPTAYHQLIAGFSGVDGSRLIPIGPSKILVVVFLGTDCPISNEFMPTLERLNREYRGKGVAFIGAFENHASDPGDYLSHWTDYHFNFPAFVDKDNSVARSLKATVTPEVAVIAADDQVVYLGRIDDRYQSFSVKVTPKSNDLGRSIDAALQGIDASPAAGPPIGCTITFWKPKP